MKGTQYLKRNRSSRLDLQKGGMTISSNDISNIIHFKIRVSLCWVSLCWVSYTSLNCEFTMLSVIVLSSHGTNRNTYDELRYWDIFRRVSIKFIFHVILHKWSEQSECGEVKGIKKSIKKFPSVPICMGGHASVCLSGLKLNKFCSTGTLPKPYVPISKIWCKNPTRLFSRML